MQTLWRIQLFCHRSAGLVDGSSNGTSGFLLAANMSNRDDGIPTFPAMG